MRCFVLALLLCSCLRAQQAGIGRAEQASIGRAEQASIEGIAIDAITRQPMAGVHISMGAEAAEGFEHGADADTYGAISRPDGHFSITDMKPGLYFLGARHNGYLYLPPKTPNGREEGTVTLKPGEPLKDVVVEMTPHAVIIGHVLDENGDPVEHVEVSAEPAAQGTARQAMGMTAMAGGGQTDDRGQFRIVLPPGKFYVQAMSNRGGMSFIQGMMGGPEIRSDGMAPPVYGPTYYPGAASKDKAVPIELGPGQNVTGIDIPLAQKRSLTISGTVTGMPENSAQGIPAFVSAFSVDENGGRNSVQPMGPAFTGPDGKFTISGVTPGHYRLMARFQGMGSAILQSPTVDVQLGNSGETGVNLALAPGETLSGTLEIEGTAKSAPAEKLTVRLESKSEGGRTPGAEVAENGTFHIDQVFPDRFRVRVMPLPENAYIKSIKVGNAQTTDGMIDLSRGVSGAGINITLSRNGGQLEGKVVGDDGNPSSGSFALVVLAATADEIDESNIKPIAPGTKFTYSGLRPGKYRLIAADPRQLSDGPGFLDAIKALFPGAPEIEIHENDRIAKDVKIMTGGNPSAK